MDGRGKPGHDENSERPSFVAVSCVEPRQFPDELVEAAPPARRAERAAARANIVSRRETIGALH
jgi:hypothetical protein